MAGALYEHGAELPRLGLCFRLDNIREYAEVIQEEWPELLDLSLPTRFPRHLLDRSGFTCVDAFAWSCITATLRDGFGLCDVLSMCFSRSVFHFAVLKIYTHTPEKKPVGLLGTLILLSLFCYPLAWITMHGNVNSALRLRRWLLKTCPILNTPPLSGPSRTECCNLCPAHQNEC